MKIKNIWIPNRYKKNLWIFFYGYLTSNKADILDEKCKG